MLSYVLGFFRYGLYAAGASDTDSLKEAVELFLVETL